MTWLSTLRESIDIICVGVTNEIKVRVWLAQMRWHMRELDNQSALDDVFSETKRVLLNEGWGRSKDCRCHSDSSYSGNSQCPAHTSEQYK